MSFTLRQLMTESTNDMSAKLDEVLVKLESQKQHQCTLEQQIKNQNQMQLETKDQIKQEQEMFLTDLKLQLHIENSRPRNYMKNFNLKN